VLTHAEDYRIMQDQDMEIVKQLATENGGLGNSRREARLLACMRLLLGHLESRTEEVGKATTAAVTVERMWINQPSMLQPYHGLHGTNVLATRESDDTCIIYFLSGDVTSQQIDPIALSKGWR